MQRKNVYICDAGHGHVSMDMEPGVTPFMTPCLHPGCERMASSLCYNVPQSVLADVTPVQEWWKPEGADYLALSPGMRAHVDKGGLVSRVGVLQ